MRNYHTAARLALAAIFLGSSSSFTISSVRSSFSLSPHVKTFYRNTAIYVSDDDAEPISEIASTPEGSSESVSTPPMEDAGASYPIPLPSPILLAGSMVTAIAATGSIFELAGGQPQYGFATSAAIVAVGLPLCFFLFYAAVKKGMAETEEDDKRFLGR